jgi:hypothetical protein
MEKEMSLSKRGTAMHNVYYNTMKGNPVALITSKEEARKRVLADNRNLYFGDSTMFFDDTRKRLWTITNVN